MTSTPLNKTSYTTLFNYAILSNATLTFGANATVNNGFYGANNLTYVGTPTISGTPQGKNDLSDGSTITTANTELSNLITEIYSYSSTLPAGFTLDTTFTGGAGTTTFVPNKIYYTSTAIVGTSGFNLIFDAQNDTNAQFFIISDGNITFTSGTMTLSNGAQASNIFWLSKNSYITFTSVTTASGAFIANNYFASTSSSVINGNIFTSADYVTFVDPVTINGDPVCYLKGTQILTEKGYISIENLEVGDFIVTKGAIIDNNIIDVNNPFTLKPITWISHFKAPNLDTKTLPICIKTNALGQNYPLKDLFVSPGHRLILNDKLILAKDLINNVTIFQDTNFLEVEYYHLELDVHSAIIANGILSETYLDFNTRGIFNNNITSNQVILSKPVSA
jgi:hypothetical protein